MKREWFDARPHPDPLPQERGLLLGDLDSSKATQSKPALGFARRRRTILPLPGGEGRGEGGCFVFSTCSSRRESALTFFPNSNGADSRPLLQGPVTLAWRTMKTRSRQTVVIAIILSALIAPMVTEAEVSTNLQAWMKRISAGEFGAGRGGGGGRGSARGGTGKWVDGGRAYTRIERGALGTKLTDRG